MGVVRKERMKEDLDNFSNDERTAPCYFTECLCVLERARDRSWQCHFLPHTKHASLGINPMSKDLISHTKQFLTLNQTGLSGFQTNK